MDFLCFEQIVSLASNALGSLVRLAGFPTSHRSDMSFDPPRGGTWSASNSLVTQKPNKGGSDRLAQRLQKKGV